MSLVLGSAELRAVARTTYQWVDNLSAQVSRTGRYREAAADMDRLLASMSKQAVDISWGTPDETSRAVPGLIAALNDVAIHAGTVDAATGATKPRDTFEALAAAKRAHGAVQTAMMQRGWHPNGHEYYWPTV